MVSEDEPMTIEISTGAVRSGRTDVEVHHLDDGSWLHHIMHIGPDQYDQIYEAARQSFYQYIRDLNEEHGSESGG